MKACNLISDIIRFNYSYFIMHLTIIPQTIELIEIKINQNKYIVLIEKIKTIW